MAHQLRTALVTECESGAHVLAARRHAFPNRASAQALPLQDRIHLGMQRTQLLATELMDLLGRHARRRRGPERPRVVGLALRQLPLSRITRRSASMRLQLRELTIERRRDFLRSNLR